MNSKKYSGEGLTESPPQTPPLNLRLRFRFSGALRPRVRAAPSIHSSNMFNNPSPNRGVLDQKEFSPCKPQLSGYTIGPNISFQDYVVGLIEIYQW